MARPLRIEFPDAIYHVTSRGNDRKPIFRDDIDRMMFLWYLAETVKRFGWSLAAWVLMTNHFHLILQTPQPNLSQGMHWLNGSYASWFNRRHKRSGHLFEGRFKSPLIEKGTHLRDALRYVVLNPVRAHMVKRPENYKWSSYRATAGLEIAPEWLDTTATLALFDPDPNTAQGIYQEFVVANLDGSARLWDRLINGMYLGSAPWTKEIRTLVEAKLRSSDHPKEQRAVGRPGMLEIIDAVAGVADQSAEVIRGSRGGSLRCLAAWLGWNEGWLTLRSIAASLRLRSEGHVSGMIRRCERELGKDPILLDRLDRATASLRS